jgi:aspartyl-tRNA(Asn)/glutamyl-tRNA(Gln) amidotransferase subunit A
MTDLALMSCESLVGLYQTRKASPVETVAAITSRIERQNSRLNAFSFLDYEGARASALESEKRWVAGQPAGALDGVVISVKDLSLTRGMPTLRGSLLVDRQRPWHEDAPGVARAREHGAIIIGKSAVPEFGCKGTTDSLLTGVTRNPWNVDMTPGGSSGGAAAAVASGMSCADIASDAGGSIRNPSALTGVVGLKPSFGRIPDFPPSPAGSMAVIGPITRHVRDAAMLMNVLALPDKRDSLTKPAEDFVAGLEQAPRDLRIAVSRTLGYALVEPDVAAAFERAVTLLRPEVGSICDVEDILPDPTALVGLFLSVGMANVYRALSNKQKSETLMDPAFVSAAERGVRLTLPEYLNAVHARKVLIARISSLFSNYDLLITPTIPVPAFPVGFDDPPRDRFACGAQWKPFSGWVNLTKLPAVSVPCGTTHDGLPIGLQIVGPRFCEQNVLRMARLFEKLCGFELPDFATQLVRENVKPAHATT